MRSPPKDTVTFYCGSCGLKEKRPRGYAKSHTPAECVGKILSEARSVRSEISNLRQRLAEAVEFMQQCEVWFLRYGDHGHRGRARDLIAKMTETNNVE